MKKTTKIISLLLILAASIFTSCSTPAASGDPSSNSQQNYKVEYGRMSKDYYNTFISSLGEGSDFNSAAFRSTRDDFKNNHTIQGTYTAQSNYSRAALTALLNRDLWAGTAEDELSVIDFMGNNLTFIDVVDSTDWVTWIYIEQ